MSTPSNEDMISRVTHNKKANLIAGFMLCAAIAYFLFNFSKQVQGVQEFCKTYPVGASIANIDQFPKKSSIRLRGPVTNSSGKTSYIACSEYSMCDIACIINVKDQVVTESYCESCGT